MSLITSEKSLKSSKPLLFIQGLKYCIDERIILDVSSLSISKGEFVSLFGPNGGGKTTLLNLIMGFLSPDQGMIKVFDMNPVKARTSMGYMPQILRPDPLFPISALEVVSLGNREGGEALKRVGMEHRAHAAFGSLSGGEAGRVLLARALAGHPRLLLLDEPVASVDPVARKSLYELLKSIKGETTIIMVTHDLEGALMLSDRLFCVQQTVEEYPKDSICHHFIQGLYHGGKK